MSRVVSRTVELTPRGATCTVIEFEDGCRATLITLPQAVSTSPPRYLPRYRPGTDGYQRAMRTIGALAESGEITSRAAQQMEEDYITDSDREERL
jgi:hypothetical protein